MTFLKRECIIPEMETQSFLGVNIQELKHTISNWNEKEIHAKAIFNSIYKEGSPSFSNIKNISESLSEKLNNFFHLRTPKVIKTQISKDDQTIKFLMGLDDHTQVETVLVPFHKKYTVCISSQVSCAMKCSFCYTGTQGLTRHLKAHEIVGQYLHAYRYLKENFPEKSAVPNIVFMGQGEPLHNFDEVKKAIEILRTTEGLYLGPRQITLSTASYLPGIKRFKELENINFALSFHSPFNSERKRLIPLNQAYPLEDIIRELQSLPLLKRQYLTFEYLVIKDLNHSKEHVLEIKSLLKDLPVIFNLIPFNPFPSSEFKRPDLKEVELFARELEGQGFHVMIRTTKGDDILAACGQLNTN